MPSAEKTNATAPVIKLQRKWMEYFKFCFFGVVVVVVVVVSRSGRVESVGEDKE